MVGFPVITGSVGLQGRNLRPDVLVVQTLLNLVPPPLGGALPKLALDAWIGPLTVGAIRHFQQHHFGGHDGRIDPGQRTIGRLQQLHAGLTAGDARLAPQVASRYRALGGQGIEPSVLPNLLSVFRLMILDIALKESVPVPGKVSDQVTLPQDLDPIVAHRVSGPVRKGWPRLKLYFDEVWYQNADMRVSTVRQGIKTPGERVRAPQEPALDGRGRPAGVHWCGLFAGWVYNEALKIVRGVPFATPQPKIVWRDFFGLTIPKSQRLLNDPRQVWPGDLCVEHTNSHHFIVLDLPRADDTVLSINGNSTAFVSELEVVAPADNPGLYSQSILVKRKSIARSNLQAVYSADDLVRWTLA